MVDTHSGNKAPSTGSGHVSREDAIHNLRAFLEGVTDPQVRESLLKTLAGLEAETEAVGAPLPPADVRARVAEALAAAGMAREPGELEITENARIVLEKRYFLRDAPGKLNEDAQGMFRRVARAIAEPERLYPSAGSGQPTNADVDAVAQEFYLAMARLEFLPNSPTLMNAGTGAGTLSACFVLPLEDSMEDIMRTAADIAMVQKYGGGTGVALSRLRPKGAAIATTHGKACGPIAVLKHLSSVSTMITQGGKRDGANMAVMDVHHPDVMGFITSKHEEGQIHNYNISVGADTEFMEAVQQGGPLVLRDPATGQEAGRMDAREVFDRIVEGAWRNGEPGVIFLDWVNADNPTPHLGRITATNPCGEQPLLPHESCNLGSIVLSRMVRYTPEGAEIDWEKLRRTVHLAVRFLDNVIDANRYSVPDIERMTKLTRKIGLGVMGFADMLVRLGVAYDSQEGLEIGQEVMRFIRQEADAASVALAEQRGVFPAFPGSRHDTPGGLRVRNACRLTVAPTGTISMIAGCSSGIEPLFALAFRKHNILEGQTLYYVDAAFEAIARHEGFFSDALAERLSQGASLKAAEDAPAWVRRLFATAPDTSPEWHVRMQAAFQDHTDAAISKTINFPHEATQEDVRRAYLLAWELGCKGITVYRAGSREKEVLTAGTQETGGKKQALGDGDAKPLKPDSYPLRPRERPALVRGITERIRTGHGNIYITINFDEADQPFEVFATLGKAGSSDSAQLEAVARLVSMALRAGVDPEEVVAQLRGITDEPVWDSGVLIRSAPDALAHALARAIGLEKGGPYSGQLSLFQKERVKGGVAELLPGASRLPVGTAPAAEINGNGNGRGGWGRCPDCSGPLVYQEGCLMCRECGYNKCG
jgi:ribonucleoside-diphosphate reductase alpha chain